MSRRKKILIGLAVAAPVLAALLYVAGNLALTAASHRVLDSLVVPARQNGVELALLDFDTARIAGPVSAKWRHVRAIVQLTKTSGFQDEARFTLSADEVVMQMAGDGMVRLEVRGALAARVASDMDEASPTDVTANERMNADRLIATFPFRLRKPGKSIRDVVPEMIQLLTDGEAPIQVASHGELTFSLRDREVTLHFSIVSIDEKAWFALDPKEVKKLASHFEEELTNAEIDLLAEHPLKAPALLQIKNDAERTSSSAAEKDPSTPEDAYRHVLWSFLLTRQFGPEFAQQVTDAHELGATDNTPADHRMDYRNNEIGRQYAAEGVARNQLLTRLKSDPRAILAPE